MNKHTHPSSNEDDRIYIQVRHELANEGFSTWFDSLPDDDWSSELESAIPVPKAITLSGKAADELVDMVLSPAPEMSPALRRAAELHKTVSRGEMQIDVGDRVVLLDGTSAVVVGLDNRRVQIEEFGVYSPVWVERRDIVAVNPPDSFLDVRL